MLYNVAILALFDDFSHPLSVAEKWKKGFWLIFNQIALEYEVCVRANNI